MISKRRRRLAWLGGGAAALLVGVLVVGATLRFVERVPWNLRGVSNDGKTLFLEIPIGGLASGCNGFDHVEVMENPRAVNVLTFAWSNVRDRVANCSADLGLVPASVELQEPLGERRLEGCMAAVPGLRSGSVKGVGEGCADTRRAFRPIGGDGPQ
jgi:hypothetical protein